jgi:PAS domain S-box-containing protein
MAQRQKPASGGTHPSASVVRGGAAVDRADPLDDGVLEHLASLQRPACLFDRASLQCVGVNDAAVHLLGGTREEAMAVSLSDLCPADDEGSPLAAGAPAELMHHAGTLRRTRAAGEPAVFDIMAQGVTRAGRRFVLLLFIERPVCARTQALLREREQLFNALVEHAPDIIARIDRELRHVYVNPAVVSATGIAAQDLIGGAHSRQGVPLELCARWVAAARRVFASGVPYHFGISFAAPGGEKHYESRMVPEIGADGRIESVLAIARDVTDTRQATVSAAAAEASGRRDRAAFEALAQSLPHPVRRYDRALRHVYANAANASLCTGSPVDAAGLSNRQAHYAPHLAALWDEELREVFDTGIGITSQFEHAGAGENVMYESRTIPLTNDTGAVDTVLWVAYQVASRADANGEAAFSAARQRNAFVREVHHRVKNNLQGVIGLLRQIANRDSALGPALGNAIVQLQAMAVIHGLQGQELLEGVPLAGMIEEIAKSVERATGSTVEYDPGRGSPDGIVCVRENEAVGIALVLNELMMNGVKHGADGGKVSVTSIEHSKRAVIEVSNRGTLHPAFDFVKDSGIGTGLELVKALLPAHGVALNYLQHGRCVKATLEIAVPVLTTQSEPYGTRDDWDRRKRTHFDRRR